MRILLAEGKDPIYLRAQWTDQVRAQTRPLQRTSRLICNPVVIDFFPIGQTQTAGKKAVQELMSAQEKHDQSVPVLQSLQKLQTQDLETLEAINDLSSTVSQLKLRYARLRELLQVSEHEPLADIAFDTYYTKRINALAVKARLRMKLQERKFENEKIEREYRNIMNSVNHAPSRNRMSLSSRSPFLLTPMLLLETNLHAQVDAGTSRRQPNFHKLATTYNKLCEDITTLITAGRAPPTAISPLPVDMKTLYELAVDDDIWQDVGLIDDEGGGARSPPWAVDLSTRTAIRALLELDRALEEETRLRRERCNLQEFAVSEWNAIQAAIASSTGVCLSKFSCHS